MIEDRLGKIDYDERGRGPALVFVPGSCSTGAAWRPIIAALGDGYRCVTTSLPGCGGTAERRTRADASMAHVVGVVETVVSKVNAPVHLVGHSFGGLVSTAVAIGGRVPLSSLTVLEAPAMMLLKDRPGEEALFEAFRGMNEAYFAAYEAGDPNSVKMMIDFYGGAGTWESWPEKVRAYARQTTAANILDWSCAYGFPLSTKSLSAVRVPSAVAWGERSHPSVKRANALLADGLAASRALTIAGAAHFMIATHPEQCAGIIAETVRAAGAA